MKLCHKVAVVLFTIILSGSFALTGCSNQTNSDTIQLQIFAANSLSKALEDVQALYVKEHKGVSFADTQYKSSGELNEMLAAGAYADILVSASKGKMDDAASAGFIDPNSRFDMFCNDLVMVTASNSAITSCTLADIAAGKYSVAVGDESVPAGNYACQALFTVGCYSSESGLGGSFRGALAESGKVVLDASVGNVCKHAQTGEVDIAFVYSSDVYRFEGVRVVGTVPGSAHKPIIYPAAICADSKNAEAAAAFLEWAFNDPKAVKLWQEWGFELIN